MDQTTKIKILQVSNKVYNKIEQDQKNLYNLEISWNTITLSSYGQKKKINLNTKKIEWINPEFNSIEELFIWANIINKIQYISKNKTPQNVSVSDLPFKVEWDNLQFLDLSSANIWTKSYWNGLVWNDLTMISWSGGVSVFKWEDWKKRLKKYLNDWWKKEVLPTRKTQ